MSDLGGNLPSNYRTTVSNIGVRDNPLLADVQGMQFVERVEGKLVNLQYDLRLFLCHFVALILYSILSVHVTT